jgi:hypothetical protein
MIVWWSVSITLDLLLWFDSLYGPRPLPCWGFEITNTPHSVGLLWMSDRPGAETSTWQYKTHNKETSMPPVGFEPAISAGERPQTHALDWAATGIGCRFFQTTSSVHQLNQLISRLMIMKYWWVDTGRDKPLGKSPAPTSLWTRDTAVRRRPLTDCAKAQSPLEPEKE